jgi:integrase
MAENKSLSKNKHRGHGEGSWDYDELKDRWRYRVSAKTPDGVTKRFAVTAATKSECRELAKAKAAQVEKGIGLNIDRNTITVAQYIERWINDYIERRVRSNTLLAYRCMLKNYLTKGIGEIALKKLQRPACQKHINEMQDKGLAGQTVRMAHSVLHSALAQAVDDKLIAENVADRCKLPALKQREAIALTPDQVGQLLASVATHPHRIAFHILFNTGVRVSELLGLRWCNVDLDAGEIRIVEQLARGKKVAYVPPKSKDGVRNPPIAPGLAAELKSHKLKQKEELLKIGLAWYDELPVVTDAIGNPISSQRFLKIFKTAVLAAVLPEIVVHDARHTALTILGNSGMDAKTLSKMAGHSKVAFTLDKYVKESKEAARVAAEKLGELLQQATQKKS